MIWEKKEKKKVSLNDWSYIICRSQQINWTVWKITWNVAELSRPFLIFGLDCCKRGSAKKSWELSNHCLCFWSTNFNHWLAVHWISSCTVDNLIQYFEQLGPVWQTGKGIDPLFKLFDVYLEVKSITYWLKLP
jgi:hypothetical protein